MSVKRVPREYEPAPPNPAPPGRGTGSLPLLGNFNQFSNASTKRGLVGVSPSTIIAGSPNCGYAWEIVRGSCNFNVEFKVKKAGIEKVTSQDAQVGLDIFRAGQLVSATANHFNFPFVEFENETGSLYQGNAVFNLEFFSPLTVYNGEQLTFRLTIGSSENDLREARIFPQNLSDSSSYNGEFGRLEYVYT